MLFAGRLVLLCALVLGTVSAAPLPALSALLAKMRAVNGGLYNMHLVSTSPQVVDGTPALTLTDAFGLRYTRRECAGDVCIGSYFDGKRLFEFNVNGTLLPAEDAADPHLRALRIMGVLDFLDPAFTARGGSIDDEGNESFAGRVCRRIIVSGPDATPLAVYVDPRTGLVAGARTSWDGSTIVLENYRRVDAFQLPFSIYYNGTEIEHYLARTIVGEPFEPPHGPKPVFNGPPAPFDLDPSSVSPLGTCKIDGTPARCLIDTGNSALAISLQLAEKLNLKPIGMLPIEGLGSYSTEVVRTGPLQLGNADFGTENFVVLSDAERYGYDLVVGADVLASMPVTIDFGKHVLSFGGEVPQDQSNLLHLHFDKFIPVVDVMLGDQPAKLAVDTGDESNINLAYNYYERHPNLFKITSTAQVGGVGGLSVEELGELPQITLGGITAQDQPIGTTRTLQGTADGHLGAEFLSKFRIVLDYPNEQIYLSPL